MEVLTIGIFCALLIICIITGKSILYALLVGLIIFSLYGKNRDIAGDRLAGWHYREPGK